MSATDPSLSDDHLREFTMRMDPRKKAESVLTLDGEDIRDNVTAVHVDVTPPLHIPEVTLVLRRRGDRPVVFDGLATVQIGEPVDPGPAAAAFLAAIDAETLEQAALNRLDLDPGEHGLTKAMLAQLSEWAQVQP